MGTLERKTGRRDRLAARLPQLLAPRAKSPLIAVFGDSGAPHGGTVWLGGLIRAVAPLGLAEPLVRTSWTTSRRCAAPADGRSIGPESGFVIRTLPRHEYRRILLSDPSPPVALMPGDWPGVAALDLCGDLYRATWHAAEAHIDAVLETADGPLPAAAPAFYRRFGGLGGAVAKDTA